MCYFSSISVGFKILETRFGARFIQTEAFQPVYSACGFGFPLLPVITGENPEVIESLNWGLVPSWIKDQEAAESIRAKTLNARAETLFEKPAFRQGVTSRRCLILITGFFEWRHVKQSTYPYLIRLKDGLPFACAGIWDIWNDPLSRGRLKTFTLITTRANPLLELIHNTQKRMPAILSSENEKHWLEAGLAPAEIQSLLAPYQGEMEAFPVSRAVRQLGFNVADPSVIQRREYPELAMIE